MNATCVRGFAGSTAAALCAMCMIATPLRADDLNFHIFSGEPASGVERPGLRTKMSAFDIFSGEPAVVQSETDLDCDLFRGSARSHADSLIAETANSPKTTNEARPVVYVYETPGCLPCLRLKRALEAADVLFRVEYRRPPEWVQSTPTLHWRTESGWMQYTPVEEGREALKTFEREWRRSR